MRASRVAVAFAFAVCACRFACAAAAEDPSAAGTAKKSDPAQLSGRNLFVYLLGTRGLKSPYPEERIAAMTALAAQGDASLHAEFKTVDLLVAVANDDKKIPKERCVALEALVRMNELKVVSPDATLPYLVTIVDDPKGELGVRMEALSLIAELAENRDGVSVMRAYVTLEDIWKKRRNYPVKMIANLVEAVGGFTANKDSIKILKEAADPREMQSSAVRASALHALQRFLSANPGEGGKVSEIVTKAVFSDKNPEERVEAILCLEVLIANGQVTVSNPIKTALLGVLDKGGDLEARAAVRVLLQTADTSIVDALLKAARYDKARGWNFETYHQVSMALGAVVVSLRDKYTQNKATAEKITDYFLATLDPKLIKKDDKGKRVMPDELVLSAVRSFGMYTREFDRRKPVQALVVTLNVANADKWTELAAACEDSLKTLTDVQVPYRTPEMLPDVDKWKAWYDANADAYLVEGKDPREIR